MKAILGTCLFLFVLILISYLLSIAPLWVIITLDIIGFIMIGFTLLIVGSVIYNDIKEADD